MLQENLKYQIGMFCKQLKGLGLREYNQTRNTNLGISGMGMLVKAKRATEISSKEQEESHRRSTKLEMEGERQGEEIISLLKVCFQNCKIGTWGY